MPVPFVQKVPFLEFNKINKLRVLFTINTVNSITYGMSPLSLIGQQAVTNGTVRAVADQATPARET